MSNSRKNQHIDCPPFKAMAYRKLKSLTGEQLRLLSIDELRTIQNDKLLQSFCSNERIDHIAMILAKVGIEWTWRFHEDEHDADMLEFNTINQYQYPHKRMDITEGASRRNVCIISSRDVMVQSHLLSQNCNTKIYGISDHTKAIGKWLQKFKKLSWVEQVANAEATHEMFGDLLLEQLNSFVYALDTLNLDEGDLRVLLALAKKRTEALRMTQISELIKSSGKKMYMRKNMQKLLDEGLVMSDAKSIKTVWANATYFIITTAGLQRILEYKKFIHQNVFKV